MPVGVQRTGRSCKLRHGVERSREVVRKEPDGRHLDHRRQLTWKLLSCMAIIKAFPIPAMMPGGRPSLPLFGAHLKTGATGSGGGQANERFSAAASV